MKKLNDDIAFWHWARARQAKSGVSWSSYWTPQYQAVLDAMTTEPSNTDKLHQAKLMKQLVDEGYFAKAEILDFYCTHAGGSLINWKSPGTFNPTLISTPEFQPYQGYRGATGKGLNLNFIPNDDATLVSQNNITVITALGDDLTDSNDDIGAAPASDIGRLTMRARHTNNTAYFRCNSAQTLSHANTQPIVYLGMRRNAAGGFDGFINKTKYSTAASTSNGLSGLSLYACGYNNNGTFTPSPRIQRFSLIFSYLTDEEYERLIDILEEYLLNYRTNIIGYDTYIAFADKSTKAAIALTTYDGSGETVHPSVVDCGAEWNGYRYWMANTPYPSSNIDYENPSIWASTDGTTWVVPEGITNPVIAKPAGNNSDPDLFYNSTDNKLYLFWKDNSTPSAEIKVSSSSDGVTWSAMKTAMVCEAGETECISPSIIQLGNTFYMYYKTYTTTVTNNPRIRRASCSTIDGTYGSKETVNVPYENDYIYWHIDVYNYNGVLYFAGMQATGPTPGTRIFIMKSTDGINFLRNPYPVLNASDQIYDARGYYRPNIAVIEDQPTLYYSCYSNLSKWGLAKVDIEFY